MKYQKQNFKEIQIHLHRIQGNLFFLIMFKMEYQFFFIKDINHIIQDFYLMDFFIRLVDFKIFRYNLHLDFAR